MKEIESYKITWNTPQNEGTIIADIKDGALELINIDSAEEALLLLDILRNEKPVFYQNGLVFTGFEEVGEEE